MNILSLALTAVAGLTLAGCAPVDDAGPSPRPPLDGPDPCKAPRTSAVIREVKCG